MLQKRLKRHVSILQGTVLIALLVGCLAHMASATSFQITN